MGEKVMYIGESLVEKLLTPEDVIQRVEDTWRWYGEGTVIMPSKITLDMSPLGVAGWMNSMPSYVQATDYAGMKWVGGYDGNPALGLPFIRAKVLLADPRNGDLKAIVSGDWISDMRTGAQPAIAAQQLAPDAGTVAIIGAGRQAYTSILCMAKRISMKTVRVCDIRPEACERFKALFAGEPFEVVAYSDAQKACDGADIVITATTANAELVHEPWLKPGSVIMTMGSFTETSDDVVLKADRRVTDHAGQAVHRGNVASLAHRGLFKEEDFDAELTGILAGKQSGRLSPEQRIYVHLVGMGAPDAAIAALLLEKAAQAGTDIPSFTLE